MTGYVFDFDGTLVNVWERYWRVFSLCSGIKVGFEEYKRLKLRLSRDGRIAEALGRSLPDNYFPLKAEKLESKALLSYDRLTIASVDVLSFFEKYPAIILTARRCEESFRWELESLGLGAIASNANVIVPGRGCKLAWLESWPDRWEETIVVGDSPEDMIAGEGEGIRSIFVCGGLFTCEAASLEYKPDYVYENLSCFIKEREIGW